MRHFAHIRIGQEDFDRINRLLAIEDLEDLSDEELLEIGANTDVCEGVFYAEFDDGSSLTFDLCSGQHNYFDDVVWTSADGSRDVVLDCEFELDDIEFAVNGEEYIVRIHKEKGGLI